MWTLTGTHWFAEIARWRKKMVQDDGLSSDPLTNNFCNTFTCVPSIAVLAPAGRFSCMDNASLSTVDGEGVCSLSKENGFFS